MTVHTVPTEIVANGTAYDYTMEIDTEKAGAVLFSPDEEKVSGDWPPMIAVPSVELVTALYYLRKLQEARERVLERARARGRDTRDDTTTRQIVVTINGGTLEMAASVEAYWLILRGDVASLIGTIPLALRFSTGELSDIMEYLAVIDQTRRTMEELDADTSKLLSQLGS